MNQPFSPTLIWHAKVLAAFLLLGIAAWCALAYISPRLPEPYQKKAPAPQTTPWLHPENVQ